MTQGFFYLFNIWKYTGIVQYSWFLKYARMGEEINTIYWIKFLTNKDNKWMSVLIILFSF